VTGVGPLARCVAVTDVGVTLLGERGFRSQWGGSGPLIPVPFVGSALGCWVKEGLGLVVHIPSGCVAKINIP
jgi:hypothetical protein